MGVNKQNMSDERTVLVIDPSEEIREAIKESLADKPCRFIELEESGEAVMQLAIEGPNIVIMAAEQTDGDGVELLKNIKAFDYSIPVIVLMGQPSKEKIVDCKKAGSLDILLRPPDYERLSARIANQLWLDPSLIKKGGEELSYEEELAKHKAEIQTEQAEREETVEAIPKGAEICNINDTAAGMKIAKTLLFNDVVYGDKGQILTDEKIKQLNKMGVPEVCVYTDEALKKKVAERKRQQANSASIKINDAGVAVGTGKAGTPGQQVFAKVKRSAVRVDVEEPTTIKYKDKDGNEIEEQAKVVDVSAGGCAMLSKEQLEKSVEITMNFSLDGGKFAMQNVKGIVRHSMKRNGTDEFPYRNGIFFNSITERFRENMITVLFRLERAAKQKEMDKKQGRTRSRH